jgi:3-deoxy-alpha-D-manno-octulosonate 8-oxidase
MNWYQERSYPALLAQQGGAPGFEAPLVSEPGIAPILELVSLQGPVIAPVGLVPGLPTNAEYPGIYNIGIPTLAGTGAEVSRTTVLTGPERKLGINSDYTPFDQIILDADLISGAPRDQRFYTAMDSYIHASESLRGTFINEFARGFAEKSQDLCREVFLGDLPDDVADEKLMVASYLGGLSIAYSQVGVCHALSYGLSFVLGTRHGVGNCVVFDHLEDYYREDVLEFRQMVEHNGITLPQGLTKGLNDSDFDKMIQVSLGLAPLWENALGKDWQSKATPAKLRQLYERM